MALAVLLLLAADMRPHPVKQESDHGGVQRAVIIAYLTEHGRACGVPSAVAMSEPQDAYLERNRVAAAAFGVRPRLDVQDTILHHSCVRTVMDSLDAYRRQGGVSLGTVRVLLEWLGLWRVQVVAAADGIRFGGSTGDTCVAGVYMPTKTVVAVIAELPTSGGCLT
ncbi:hypothetical protein Rhe02_79920 [Rhizocola hellebori]|uniref:Uncharacterized protein n=2 Tax=Rhizocola hellebori TaxID=1392758 RepID=A0A8J3VKN2_9ACTN|nr:hypothetical protein Rhe02_79920 [Rhizocola hellebori]